MSIRDRINSLANAISIADQHGLFDTTELEQAIEKSSSRLGYGDEFCVIAIAGSTGSGKSALLNAIAKFEQPRPKDIVESGETRPYTTESQAAIFTLPHAVPEGFLEWMGISRRIVCPPGSLRKLVIVDLPDFDSIRQSNVEQVERILKLCDGIIWVTDPQKYADNVLHKTMLRPMLTYQRVMRFVLNKIDTVLLDDIQPLHKHWVDLLREDGFHNPRSFAVSATSGKGIEELFTMVVEMGQHREIMVERLDTDLDKALTSVPQDFQPLTLSTSYLEQDLIKIINLDQITNYCEDRMYTHYMNKSAMPVYRWWNAYRRSKSKLRLEITDIPVQLIARIQREWILKTQSSFTNLPSKVQETLNDSARPIAVGLERIQSRITRIEPPNSQAWQAAKMLQDLVSGLLMFALIWMLIMAGMFAMPYITPEIIERYNFRINSQPLWFWVAVYSFFNSVLIHVLTSLFAKIESRVQSSKIAKWLTSDTHDLVEKNVSVPLAVYSYAQHECLVLLQEGGLENPKNRHV